MANDTNLKLEKLREKKKELLFQTKRVARLKEEKLIRNEHDLYGDDDPSFLFPVMIHHFESLLKSDEYKDFTEKSLKNRKWFSSFVRFAGPLFLKTPQIFEDRNELMNLPSGTIRDSELPDSPIIFVSNHKFRDDILGTVIAAKKHAYVMFASLPQFYNTIDGLLLYYNGVVLINRKVREHRKSSIGKSVEVLKNGGNLIIFPEGVWNKSPNKISLPLWNGVYRIAKEAGAKIVPISHYIKDPTYSLPKKDNPFHTVIDDPIDPSNLSEEETLQKISDSFNTWTYLMMEKYGKTTREDLLRGYQNPQEAWEDMLRKRVATADKYDLEIETSADYIPKNLVTPYDAFVQISELELNSENAQDVLAAKKLIKEFQANDFQHHF